MKINKTLSLISFIAFFGIVSLGVSLCISGTVRLSDSPIKPIPTSGAVGFTADFAGPYGGPIGETFLLPPSIGPGPSSIPGPTMGELPNLPLDFKRQELLQKKKSKKGGKQSGIGHDEQSAVPNLDPLISQIIRHADLQADANKILPWVYATTTEMVVADFEDAFVAIDEAGELIDQAMLYVLMESSTLHESNLPLIEATTRLDDAELTIILLMELARLEL